MNWTFLHYSATFLVFSTIFAVVSGLLELPSIPQEFTAIVALAYVYSHNEEKKKK